MKKKTLALTLIVVGLVLVISAVFYWVILNSPDSSQNSVLTISDWVAIVIGLLGLGANIKGWMDFFKKERPISPTTKNDINGGNLQISSGDHARNIQAQTYIEYQTVQQPLEPKTPKSLNQLPSPPLDFIGREKELAQLRNNIKEGVLISGVQGMGGIGKTALGLKLADELAPNYPDGQIYLDLRGINKETALTPEHVMIYVIQSFYPESVLPTDPTGLGAMYRSVLNGKKVLLFYDNAYDEDQLRNLLPPKNCMLFVTSRQHFSISGLRALVLEVMNFSDANNLVKEIVPEATDKEAASLAQQCGYLPLAIQIAVRVLWQADWSISDLIKKLETKSTKLGLVANILNISCEALDVELRNYLYQLGVFSEPFDVEEITAIWFDPIWTEEKSPWSTLPLHLIEKLKTKRFHSYLAGEALVKSLENEIDQSYDPNEKDDSSPLREDSYEYLGYKDGMHISRIYFDTDFYRPFIEWNKRLFEIKKRLLIKSAYRQKTDKILGDLLRSNLLKFDLNTKKYYFHDLVRLFLGEKFMEFGNSRETLERYRIYLLNSVGSLMYVLTKLENFLLNRSSENLNLLQVTLSDVITMINHYESRFHKNLSQIVTKPYFMDDTGSYQAWELYINNQTSLIKDIGSLKACVIRLQFAGMGVSIVNDPKFSDRTKKLVDDCIVVISEIRLKYLPLVNTSF